MYFAFFCLEGSLHHHSAQLASSSEPYLHFQPYSHWGLFLTIVCHIQNVKGTLNSVPKLHQYFLDHFSPQTIQSNFKKPSLQEVTCSPTVLRALSPAPSLPGKFTSLPCKYTYSPEVKRRNYRPQPDPSLSTECQRNIPGSHNLHVAHSLPLFRWTALIHRGE